MRMALTAVQKTPNQHRLFGAGEGRNNFGGKDNTYNEKRPAPTLWGR
ncbi:hypothetical protein ACIBLB_09380 [Streptosporangium canum]